MGRALLKHAFQNSSSGSIIKVAYNPSDVGLTVKGVNNYLQFDATNMVETLKFIVVNHTIPYQNSLQGGYIITSKTKWEAIKEPKSAWSYPTESQDQAYLSDTVSGMIHTTNIKCDYTNVSNIIFYLHF